MLCAFPDILELTVSNTLMCVFPVVSSCFIYSFLSIRTIITRLLEKVLQKNSKLHTPIFRLYTYTHGFYSHFTKHLAQSSYRVILRHTSDGT